MKFFYFIAFFAVGLVCADEAETIQHLSAETFTAFQVNNPVFLLLSTAAICPRCPKLHAFVEKTVKHLAKRKVPAAELDLPSEPALAEKLKLTEYPQLSLMHKGQLTPYKGKRTIPALMGWLDQLIGAKWAEIDSPQQLAAFRLQSPSLVYFMPQTTAFQLGALAGLPRELPHVYWGSCIARGVAAEESISEPFMLAVGSPKFVGLNRLESPLPFTPAEVRAFAISGQLPAVAELTPDLAAQLLSGARPAAVLLSHAEDEPLLKAFEAAAGEFGAKLAFAAGAGDEVRLAQFRRLSRTGPTQNAVMLLRKGRTRLDTHVCAELTLAGLRKCVRGFLAMAPRVRLLHAGRTTRGRGASLTAGVAKANP